MKRKWIPTPLIEAGERPPIPLVVPRKPRFRRLTVFTQILLWLGAVLLLWLKKLPRFLVWWIRNVPWPWMRELFGGGSHGPGAYRRSAKKKAPEYPGSKQLKAERTKRMMERLGFLWIKIGQIVSLRRDLLSDEMCKELSRLQHQTIGFESWIAREIIEDELGCPIDRVFCEFEDVPLAAASIGQVHRARLRKNNRRIVIKVMRPFADEIFRDDMRFFRIFVTLLIRFKIYAFARWDEMLHELNQMMTEEIDYGLELENTIRLRKNVKKHGIYAPKAYRKLSTSRILVLEYIDGIMMSDFIKMAIEDPPRLQRWMDENKVDPKKVARKLLQSFMRQVTEENFFHGDLHPGNIMLLRKNKTAMIDMGSIGTLEDALKKRFDLVLYSITTREYNKAAEQLIACSSYLPLVDMVRVKEELVRNLRAWEARVRQKALPYHEKSVSQVLTDTTNVFVKYGIGASWEFLRSDRTMSTLDASLSDLIPTMHYPKEFARYYEKRRARMMSRIFQSRTYSEALSSMSTRMTELELSLGPMLQKRARNFMAGVSRAKLFLSVTFHTLTHVVVAVGVVLVLAFVHQHRPARTPDWVPYSDSYLRLRLEEALAKSPQAVQGPDGTEIENVDQLIVSLSSAEHDHDDPAQHLAGLSHEEHHRLTGLPEEAESGFFAWTDKELSKLPELSGGEWLLFLIIDLYILWPILVVRRRLKKPEVFMPDGSRNS